MKVLVNRRALGPENSGVNRRKWMHYDTPTFSLKFVSVYVEVSFTY